MVTKTVQENIVNVNFEIGFSKIPDLGDFVYESFDFYASTLYDVVYVEIEQSLEMMFKTAKLIFTDRKALRELFPITGNEVITIRYKNALDSSKSDEKIIHFRIFNIEEVPKLDEQNSQNASYMNLNLVEFPAFDFLLKNTVYLSYPWGGNSKDKNNRGHASVSQIIEDMLKLVPNLENWYDIEIDPTLNSPDELFNFYIPNWTPMKTIKYLERFAVDEREKDFRYFTFTTFHSTGEGIRPKMIFRSVYNYLESKDSRLYSAVHSEAFGRKSFNEDTLAAETIDDIPDDNYAPADYIKSKKIIFGDGAQIAFSRVSGKTVVGFDYIEDNNYQAFDFEDFINNYKSQTSLHSVHSKKHGNQWSSFKTTPFTNINQVRNQFLNEYNKLSMQNVKCNIQTHVNQLRHPGEVAFLYMPSEYAENAFLDMMFQGRWITWSIKDIILSNGEGMSQVEFRKDGFFILTNNPEGLPEYNFIGDSDIPE